MGLNKGKHVVAEINGVRCTVVETGLSQERMNFLKDLLEFNKFTVQFAAEKVAEGTPVTYILGVTDIIFNPVIAVYERKLKTPDGFHITADFWNQKTDVINPFYWRTRV